MQVNVRSYLVDDAWQSDVAIGTNDNKLLKVNAPKKPISEAAAAKDLLEYFPRLGSGLMPPGLRYLSPDRRTLIYEQPPRYVEIAYTNAEMGQIEGARKTFTVQRVLLPMPWLVYVASLTPECKPNNIYVFVTNGQLTSLTNPISALPLINFFNDGRLCRAPQDNNEDGFPNTIEGAIAAMYYAVWMTGFNTDLHQTIFHARDKGTPQFLAKGEKSIPVMLGTWSDQTLRSVVESQYPKVPWKTLKDFLTSGTLAAHDGVDMRHFFVTRVSSSYQNNAV